MSSATPTNRKRSTTEPSSHFRYLEFYAGVGGWRMALEEALRTTSSGQIVTTEAVGALEHSDLCLQVYHHNFPTHQKVQACRIEKITTRQLVDEWSSADAWFLSPPCQPHTRQHDNQAQDLNDPRSASFLHLCRLLEEIPTEHLPTMICLENVVGFAESNSCRVWRKALSHRAYAVAHFHWNPTQVGLPNDRPRYFCLAVLQEKLCVAQSEWKEILSVETDLEQKPNVQSSLHLLGIHEESAIDATNFPRIRDFLENSASSSHVSVPQKLLERNASWCFDIVSEDSQRSACFTSGYGKFVKGTGSVLYQGSQSPDQNTLEVSVSTRSKFRHTQPEDKLGTQHHSLDAFQQAVSFVAPQEKRYTLVLVTEPAKQRILLGKKHRGFGQGMFNSFGGKIERGETEAEGARRELMEETGIEVPLSVMSNAKVGVLHFTFDDGPTKMTVHLFRVNVHSSSSLATQTDQDDSKSRSRVLPLDPAVIRGCDEISPAWVDNWYQIPLDKMFADDSVWLTHLLDAKEELCLDGYFHFCAGGQETNQIKHYFVDSRPKDRLDLSLKDPQDRTFEADWATALESGSLRYFSGREIGRLLGFPKSFSFPESCTPKQQWKLVGNSLNVRLAAKLILLGLVLCGKASLTAAKPLVDADL